MSSEEQTTELIKTASMRLPHEIVGSSENAEKRDVMVGEQQIGNAAVGEAGISSRRLMTIMIGLCLTIFLTALDQVNPP
jgi:tetrahydromethanopterin S-methyltransferase subunit A